MLCGAMRPKRSAPVGQTTERLSSSAIALERISRNLKRPTGRHLSFTAQAQSGQLQDGVEESERRMEDWERPAGALGEASMRRIGDV